MWRLGRPETLSSDSLVSKISLRSLSIISFEIQSYDLDMRDYPLVMTNIAIENGPFKVIFPLNMVIFPLLCLFTRDSLGIMFRDDLYDRSMRFAVDDPHAIYHERSYSDHIIPLT